MQNTVWVRLPPAPPVKIMKRALNEGFFKEWNEDSAYLIGFICADGCIHKRKDREKSLILTITSKDRDHLKKINQVLKSSYSISRKNNGSGGFAFHLAITNYRFCQSIIDKGILPRKTLTMGPIEVPKKYFRDFIRGFFDADGSVYIYLVNNTPQLKIGFVCASKKFIEFLSRQLSKALNIREKKIYVSLRKGRVNPIYSIVFYINDSQKLSELMYGHRPNLYLERKFQIFEKWKETERRKYSVCQKNETACDILT